MSGSNGKPSLVRVDPVSGVGIDADGNMYGPDGKLRKVGRTDELALLRAETRRLDDENEKLSGQVGIFAQVAVSLFLRELREGRADGDRLVIPADLAKAADGEKVRVEVADDGTITIIVARADEHVLLGRER